MIFEKKAKNIRLVKMVRPSNLKRKALCHVFPVLEELPFAEEIMEKQGFSLFFPQISKLIP